jgi:hypothetical protein
MKRGALLLLAVAVTFTGCLGALDDAVDDDDLAVGTSSVDDDVPSEAPVDTRETPAVNLTTDVGADITFDAFDVEAAVGYTADLYEPTIEVSDQGVIYVTGHTILVDTTGAPVFKSEDGGETWEQLPFFEDLQMLAGIPGATPPPSDEIFLSAGEEGWLYGVDITAATFPVNAWESDGDRHAYHNPNAYDRVDATTSGECGAVSLNDRPWGVAANGKLLMVSNPGTGTVQLGAMSVPPDDQVDEPGNPATGPTWNMCAGETSYIPGIPDMRDDHFFAVPYQHGDEEVRIAKGNAANVMNVDHETVFDATSNPHDTDPTSNYGQVVFDEEGTMFVGIRNNTDELSDGEPRGQLKIAASTDDGETFETRTFVTGELATNIYMDGNMHGPGALLTWAENDDEGTDWYAAHMYLGDDGAPVVENVSLALDDGPPPSAHVQGAAVGPDGQAHMVLYYGDYSATDRARPLDLLAQQDGPELPVDVEAP